MGSHSSSRNDLNENKTKKNISKIINGDNIPMEMNIISNELNNNVKMDTSDNTKSVSGRSTSKETIEIGSEIQDNRVPTLFEWNDGGDSVFVTGSFCGWGQKIPLTETAKETYKVILNLPKGIYQYKYIVDGQWMYNPHLPTFNDGLGNINNYIDNSNYRVENTKCDNDIIYSPSQNHQPNHHQNRAKNRMLMDFFSNTFPSKNQLNTDSPVVPCQYSKLLNLNYNSNQPLIGEMAFIPRKIDLSTENNAATSITFPSHVILYIYHYINPFLNRNHIFTKINQKSYTKTCGTLRVRAKFSTFIYIKPL